MRPWPARAALATFGADGSRARPPEGVRPMRGSAPPEVRRYAERIAKLRAAEHLEQIAFRWNHLNA
jgi:hypothetical protein